MLSLLKDQHQQINFRHAGKGKCSLTKSRYRTKINWQKTHEDQQKI